MVSEMAVGVKKENRTEEGEGRAFPIHSFIPQITLSFRPNSQKSLSLQPRPLS